MKDPAELQHERDLASYNQNVETFRSLNGLMWQIPLLAMTLTGGLWFGVSKVGDDPWFKIGLLALALFGNVGLILVLGRLRYIMSRYLDWLEAFNPGGHVSAPGEGFLSRQRLVVSVFRSLLALAAITSGALMWSTLQKAAEADAGASLGSMEYYDRHAADLADGYEGVRFEAAHPAAAAALNARGPSDILDVGSGTGRDAAWMAAAGHRVTAVEPSEGMRRLATSLHPEARVRWIPGSLPQLATLEADARFDMILVSAVWMHVHPRDRAASIARLADLLAPMGTIHLTLRDGPADPARAMHGTSVDEVRALARQRGLAVQDLGTADDLMGRKSITWRMLALTRA